MELLDSALDGNTLVCLGAISSRMFLTVMLLKETAAEIRVPLSQGGKRSIFLVNNGEIDNNCVYSHSNSIKNYFSLLKLGYNNSYIDLLD